MAAPADAVPKCILLVEDEILIAMEKARELAENKYNVVTALSGSEAIEIVHSGRNEIDLILMDIELGSGMDGTEAAREILKNYNIPIVFISSHAEKEIVDRTERITSYGYVVKHSGASVLDASIKMALRLHEAHCLLKEKENLIGERERYYRTLFETTGTATVIFEDDAVITQANAKFAQLCGYSRREIEGKKKWTDFVAMDDMENMLRLHRLRREHDETALRQYEFRFVTGNGDVRDIFLTIDMLPGTTKSVASLLDITELKRAERLVRQKDEEYRRLFDNSILGIFQTTPGGELLSVNLSLAKILGYDSVEDLMASTGSNAANVYANPRQRSEIISMILGGESLRQFETDFRRKDGGTTIGQLYVWPVYDDDGNVLRIEGFAHDVTNRKQAEDNLKAALRQLNDIIDFLPDPTFVIDDDGKVIYWNNAMEHLTGVKKADMLGRGEYAYAVPFYGEKRPILIDLTGLSTAEVEAKYDYVRHMEHTVYAETHIPHMNDDDGAYLWGAAAPLFDSGGRRIGAIEIIRDITERRNWEKALEKSLEEKNILMKELQHRVKNNLNLVASLISLGMGELADEHSKKVYEDAVTQIHAIARIYDQLNSGTDLQHADLDEYMRKMIVSLVDTYALATDRVGLSMNLEKITLDVKRVVPLGLIVNELITNAIKYAFPGGRSGRLKIELGRKDETVVLTVSDDGVGLPENVRSGDSRGMGFQLIEILVKQIRGRLALESERGTTARVTFDI